MFEYEYDIDYIISKNNSIDINSFQNWLQQDKTHPFSESDGEDFGLCYRADAIVYWINKYRNDGAYILESHTNKKIKYDKLIIL